MSKTHYSCAELAAFKLHGLPTSRQNWSDLVKREGWPYVEAPCAGGKCGIRREYAPPPAILKEIREQERIAAAVDAPALKLMRKLAADLAQLRADDDAAAATTAKDASARAGHDVLWGSLRTYLPGAQAYGDVTLLALRMKASNQLSAQSARRINVLGTRMLPIWDSITGWSAPAATRSIAWAAADICRAAYGGALPDSAIDLDALAALDVIWAARTDEFNAGFDQRVTFWEALSKVCRAGRCKPYIQGGIIRFARDAAASLPVAMFTPRNIVSGSFRTEYLLPSDDRADDVTVTYIEEDVWKPRTVACTLPGSASAKPAKISPFGITNRAQAWREGIYEAASNKYRTRIHTFETEMEGFILSPLDLIAISRDRPSWGQSGEILGYTALDVGGILELSEPIAFITGNHYLAARKRDGSMAGPWRVTAGADELHAVLAEAMTGFTPDTGTTRERTAFAFGPSTNYIKRARVLPDGLRVKGMHQVEIACVAEDDRVHDADSGTAPASSAGWTLPSTPTVPVVTGLLVMQGGTPESPVLAISWRPAPGALSYLVERSDDGVIWTGVGEFATTHITIAVLPGTIHLRVAGIGATRGAWATWADDAGSDVAPPSDVTGLALSEAFTGPALSVKWSAAARASSYTVAVWQGSTLVRSREVSVLNYSYTATDAIVDGLADIGRDLSIKVRATGNGTTSANWASVTINNPQIGALSGVQVFSLLASLLVKYNMPAAPDFAGVCVWASSTPGFTPGSTNLKYRGPNNPVTVDINPGEAWYLRIAAYDVWGEDGLTLSAELNSTTALIGADMIAAGTIIAGGAIIADGAITNAKIGAVIQSNSYVAGSSGWMINKNGTAEFRNITARGNIEATSLNAATGTFTGSLSAATGTFSGTLLAGTGSPDVSLGVTYTYTASQTITVPSGYDRMAIRVIGGGGGGGGSVGNNTEATYLHGAGGGAGSSNSVILNVTPGQTYALVIGPGGAGGAGGSHTYEASAGAAGGDTAVLYVVGASGGAGGAKAAIARYTDYVVTGAPTAGASSSFGAGGAVGANGDSPAAGGVGGTAAGGGGASSGASGTNWGAAGGNGGSGYAIIEYYQANAVVLRAEMVTLKAELTAQGHTLS